LTGEPVQIKSVAVLGAGTMGHGIAEISAIAGYQVVVTDVEQRFLDAASERITWSVKKLAEKGQVKEPVDVVLSRIRFTLNTQEAVREADVVIEATPEDLDLKRNVLSQVAKYAKSSAILATNTSSLPITELATALPDKSRLVGLHFFNPPVIMSLVEVIRGADTSQSTLDAGMTFVRKLGKRVVLVHKDIPGFIVNRIMARIMATACLFVQLQLASIVQVDASLKYRAGLPMGAFELADYVGLDVLLNVERALSERGFDIEPSPLLEQKVKERSLGVKAGAGFYRYSAAEPKARVPAEEADKVNFVDLLSPAVNEAARLVQDGISSERDIDTAVVLGLGFPRGLLEMADSWGIDAVVTSLKSLQVVMGKDWMAPCKYLEDLMAQGRLGRKSGRGFYEYSSHDNDRWETVGLEKRGPVAYVSLNRPERLNAINEKMLGELDSVMTTLERDGSVRVVVIRGEGKAFCSGFDLSYFMVGPSPHEVMDLVSRFQRLNRKIESLAKPVVASIHGYCLGGGFELALSCDFRLAERSAILGQPEINLGLIPGAGGTQRITRLAGPAKARKLVFFGDRISASDAERMGLVDGVYDDGKLEEGVQAFAAALSERPPLALAAAKRAINASMFPMDAGLDLESTAFSMLFSTEDAREGLSAFSEKRKPKFIGK